MGVLAGVQCDVRATQALEGGRGEGVWRPASLPRGCVRKPGTGPPLPHRHEAASARKGGHVCVHAWGPTGAGRI